MLGARVRRRASRSILALSLAAVTVVGLRSLSRTFLFPTSRLDPLPAHVGGAPLVFEAEDGAKVHALWFAPSRSDARVVVAFHTNRQTMESNAALAGELRERGLGVLLVEYRGYGRSSDGEPSEQGLYEDASAALDHLERAGIARDRVVLLGYSLGTGVAAEMASRGRCSKVILIAPYTSIPDLVTDVAPGVPAGVLVPDHFDTLAKASHIAAPTLVIHGDADEIVPFWMGARLEEALPHARLLRVRGGHHGDLFAREHDRLVEQIVRFSEA